MRPPEEIRPDLAGDGYDSERLLKADEVGRLLNVPKKRVPHPNRLTFGHSHER